MKKPKFTSEMVDVDFIAEYFNLHNTDKLVLLYSHLAKL